MLCPPAGCAGDTAVMCVSEFTVTLLAANEPNNTLLAPANPDPVIVTDVPPPIGPEDGDTPVTTGAAR
jgi:hypothetical protein